MKFKSYLLQELVKTELSNTERLREIRMQAQYLLKADELREKMNKKLEGNCYKIDEETIEISNELDAVVVKMQEFKINEVNRGNIEKW